MMTRNSVLGMAPGSAGVAKPAEGQSLEAFQAVVDLLADLQSEGEIKITHCHREEQSGHDYVDVVMFRRRDEVWG